MSQQFEIWLKKIKQLRVNKNIKKEMDNEYYVKRRNKVDEVINWRKNEDGSVLILLNIH